MVGSLHYGASSTPRTDQSNRSWSTADRLVPHLPLWEVVQGSASVQIQPRKHVPLIDHTDHTDHLDLSEVWSLQYIFIPRSFLVGPRLRLGLGLITSACFNYFVEAGPRCRLQPSHKYVAGKLRKWVCYGQNKSWRVHQDRSLYCRLGDSGLTPWLTAPPH